MSKRFTDTEKWDRPWFRKLTPKLKAFWQYLCDKCDQIGIWYVDFELASLLIGEPIEQGEALTHLGKQIQVLGDGSRWFLKDFISFQYGELKDTNNFHISLRLKLKKSGVYQPLTSPSSGDKEKDKEYLSLVSFEEFYLMYPKKQDRKKAQEVWESLKVTKEKWGQQIKPKLEAFKNSEDWKKERGQFVPMPSTWLRRRRWEDDVPKGEKNESRNADFFKVSDVQLVKET